jgi:hypothetical protein
MGKLVGMLLPVLTVERLDHELARLRFQAPRVHCRTI